MVWKAVKDLFDPGGDLAVVNQIRKRTDGLTTGQIKASLYRARISIEFPPKPPPPSPPPPDPNPIVFYSDGMRRSSRRTTRGTLSDDERSRTRRLTRTAPVPELFRVR